MHFPGLFKYSVFFCSFKFPSRFVRWRLFISQLSRSDRRLRCVEPLFDMRACVFLLLLAFSPEKSSFSQQATAQPTHPKTALYFIVLHPILSLDDSGATFNFTNKYTVGIPVGLNFLYSDKIGFSFEFAPSISVSKGFSKMDNFLFHPGILFRFKHGFTFATRLAFETSGRYGATLNFSQIVLRRKKVNYFFAIPVPFRLGNGRSPSIGLALQLGISF